MAMIADWNLDKRPRAEPVRGERYHVKYETHGNASGYRDITLCVSFDGDPERQLPIELQFSAQDGERIARDVIDIHRRAWRDPRGPNKAEGETRPSWSSLSRTWAPA